MLVRNGTGISGQVGDEMDCSYRCSIATLSKRYSAKDTTLRNHMMTVTYLDIENGPTWAVPGS
jgi:hypothetical protein